MSQFALRDIVDPAYGSLPQKLDAPASGTDFMIRSDEWLARQNGIFVKPSLPRVARRYLTTGRDLADWAARNDALFLNAAAALYDMPAALSQSRPELRDPTGLIGLATNAALIGAFHQKFAVHRRLRPEAFFALLDAPPADVRFDPALMHANVLARLRSANGTSRLPMAHPNGSPAHPSYPAAHAVGAGAAITILKAFVAPDAVYERPMIPSADGSTLDSFVGEPLTVAGELDKLAFNFAYGRHWDGLHYRSDSDAGLRFGEAAAAGVLYDVAAMCGTGFAGFRFRTFDGVMSTIAA